MELDRLLQPADLGGIRVRNRLVMPTHGPRLFGRDYLRYLEERAVGGIGMAGLPAGFGIGDAPFVPGPGTDGGTDDPLSGPGRRRLDERVIPMLAEQAALLHDLEVACVGQLHHAGANRNGDDFHPTVAPSAVVDPFARQVPHVLRGPEIGRLIDLYAQGARRVREAGCDGVEIHAGHGYLVHQFLSPATNHRTDAFGGDPGRRLRFLDELVAGIREQVGDDFPIGVRLNGGDGIAGGLQVEDVVAISRHLEATGVAYLNISGGTYTGWRDGVGLAYVSPSYVPEGHNLPAAAAVTAAVDVPVIATGRISDLQTAEAVLADGHADLVGMVRALIAEPRLLELARDGRGAQARRCVVANECHTPGRPVVCAVNPSAGREATMNAGPASVRRRVVVIGAGVAGLEAATAAALRGHDVRLLERGSELGGALLDLSRDPNRPELARHLRAAVSRLEAAQVTVELGVDVDVDTAATLEPDAVILATGSRELVPDLLGGAPLPVVTALPVLSGERVLRGRVVVVGGLEDTHPPLVVADRLAADGCEVTLVTELPDAGPGIEPATRFQLLQRLVRGGCRILPASRPVAVGADGVELVEVLSGARSTVPADAVVAAGTRVARDGLADGLVERLSAAPSAPTGAEVAVHVVGDALAPRRIVHATTDAARVAAIL